MLTRGGIAGACITGVLVGALAGGCVIVVSDGDGAGTSRSIASRRDRPRIGVYTAEPGNTLAAQLNINRKKTTVLTGVISGSPADRAGLQKYDIITSIDGGEDADPDDLRRAVRAKSYGDVMTFDIIRSGQPMSVTVVLDPPARQTPSS